VTVLHAAATKRARIAARYAVVRAVTGGFREALKGRTLLAVVAIAFGIALGYAVELVNHAAVSELDASLALLSGNADLEVRGPRAGFDERLYPALARDRDVAVASPVVEVDAKLRDRNEPLVILGVDVFRAAAINPSLVATRAAASSAAGFAAQTPPTPRPTSSSATTRRCRATSAART